MGRWRNDRKPGALEEAFGNAEKQAGIQGGAIEALELARKNRDAMESTRIGQLYCCGRP